MTPLETEHLLLRHLSTDDAAFFLELVNEPTWLAYIPDKGLHTVAAAREYILREPLALQARVGFSPYAVVLRERGAVDGEPHEPIGICGLVKRDELEDPDIAFAFLGRHCHRGHGFEAASRVLEHAREDLGLKRVVAITDWGNQPSRKLLLKLGFALEGGRTIGDEAEELAHYAIELI